MKNVEKLLKLRETTETVLWFYTEAIQGKINEENGNKNGREIIKEIESYKTIEDLKRIEKKIMLLEGLTEAVKEVEAKGFIKNDWNIL